MQTEYSYTVHLADLREAQSLDAATPLFDAYRQFYGRDSDVEASRSFLAERAERGQSAVYLGYAPNGQAHGFMQLYPSFSSVSLVPVCVLNDLYVSPAARRSGLARQLLASAQRHALKSGAIRLSLSTQVTNTSAQALYEGAGWVRDTSFFHYAISVVPKDSP